MRAGISMRAAGGNWNDVWSSFDKRQGAKAKGLADEAGAESAKVEGPRLSDAGSAGAGSVEAE